MHFVVSALALDRWSRGRALERDTARRAGAPTVSRVFRVKHATRRVCVDCRVWSEETNGSWGGGVKYRVYHVKYVKAKSLRRHP